MSEQDVRAKNFAFNYQSDIFNQKAPVKEEYNYSHKAFHPNSSNKASFNFLAWENNKQNSSIQNSTHIKRTQNIPKIKMHQKFEEKLYNTEPNTNLDSNRGQKETIFLGNYEGDEYKIKKEKNNEYNPSLYYKTKKPEQIKKEQTYGKNNENAAKPSIKRSKLEYKVYENKVDKNNYINQNDSKKIKSLNIERSTNNEYNPKYDPKQNKVNMLKSNIFNDEKIEEMNKKEANNAKNTNNPTKRILKQKKDNFGKKSKFDKNSEKLPMNLDWRDTKTNLLFNGESNKEILKKDARQRKFKEIYGSDPAIPKERTENNFKVNDRNIIEKTTKEMNPDLNQAKIKKISENISQLQGNQFINDSSKYKIKNNNNEDNIKLYEINSKDINQKEIERAFAEKGIKIFDIKEDIDSIFGNKKNNRITFKIRDNEYDKNFDSKVKSVQKEFKNNKNLEIKAFSEQEKKKTDLIPNTLKWNDTNINSKNKNVDKNLQEKIHSKPMDNNNEPKVTKIFYNLKYKNEQNII